MGARKSAMGTRSFRSFEGASMVSCSETCSEAVLGGISCTMVSAGRLGSVSCESASTFKESMGAESKESIATACGLLFFFFFFSYRPLPTDASSLNKDLLFFLDLGRIGNQREPGRPIKQRASIFS